MQIGKKKTTYTNGGVTANDILIAVPPLSFDQTTGTMAMQKATSTQAGYLDPSDYIRFGTGFQPIITVSGLLKNNAGTLVAASSGDVINALTFTPENAANKGAANGYASLDSSSRLPASQLPVTALTTSGGTLIGSLILNADPTSALMAATKQYVDAHAGGSSTLASDTDVTITSPATNQLLQYNGSKWVNFTPSYLTSISSSNVTTALGYTPAHGGTNTDIIALNGLALGSDATGDIYYRNASGFLTRLGIGSTNQILTVISGLPSWQTASAGSATLAADTDVVLTSPATNQLLQYNGSKWVNFTPTYLTSISSGNVTTALGYTPAHSGANSDITALSGLTTALTVGQGGTGAITLTGIVKGNGTAAFTTAITSDLTTLLGYTPAHSGANSDITSLTGLTTPLTVAQGGTGTGTVFTTGSVVFTGASGVRAQNNTHFFWDNTNNRLGIGTTTPTNDIHVIGNIAIDDLVSSPTKGYKFRTDGGALDLQASGNDLYLSVFTNAGFTGTQQFYCIFNAASYVVRAMGKWQFQTSAGGAVHHIIDAQTNGNVTFNNDLSTSSTVTINGTAANLFVAGVATVAVKGTLVVGDVLGAATYQQNFYQGTSGTAGNYSYLYSNFNNFYVHNNNGHIVLESAQTEANSLYIQENAGSFTAFECWYDGPSGTSTGANFAVTSSSVPFRFRLGDTAGSSSFIVMNSSSVARLTVTSQGVTTITGALNPNGGIAPVTSGYTSFATGGAANLLNSSSGNDTVMVAGKIYWAAVFIPMNATLTGIITTTGTVGGTDKWIVSLHNSSGVVVANSVLTGTTAVAAGTKARIPFTATYNALGPGLYYISLQSNGTTARFLSFGNSTEGFVTGSVTGAFGTIPTITPGSTYTAGVGPYATTY